MIKEKIADGLLQLQGKEQDAYFHLLPYHDDQVTMITIAHFTTNDNGSPTNVVMKDNTKEE